MARVEFEQFPAGTDLAYIAEGPPDDRGVTGFFWLGGFMSDMQGAKGEALSELARSTRRSLLRFDYSGHGRSGGEFRHGTMSRWLEEATHMFLSHTRGRRVVIGSSMGGWLALLLVRKLLSEDDSAYRRIAGLVLIAPAADMTRDLMWDSWDAGARRALLEEGVYLQPSDYGSPYPITRGLIEDGNRHLIMKEGMHLGMPVRILQGLSDTDVPSTHAIKLLDRLSGGDITLTLIKGGDHRLSSPVHLRIIRETALRLAQRADGDDA